MSYIFPKHPELAKEVSAFMAANPNLKPTRFGLDALNDKMLLAQLQQGRELRQRSVDAIRAYMLTRKPTGRRTAATVTA